MQRFFLIITFSLVLFISCSDNNSKSGEIYKAEKLYAHALKIQKNILINPDIANPEEYEKAEKTYRSIIDKFSRTEEPIREIKGIIQKSWLSIADLFIIQKKYDKAIDLYKEIIKKSASDQELCAAAQYSMGQLHEKLGNLDDAIHLYHQVVRNYSPVLSDTVLPNFNILQTPIHIARLYLQQGQNGLADQQYAQAREYYSELISKWPNSPTELAAQNQIAISYSDQGNWGKASEILNSIIYKHQQGLDVSDLMLTLANIYHQRMGQSDRAMDTYQRVIQQYPQSKNLYIAYLGIGGIYLSQHNFERARNEFSFVIDNFKKDKEACLKAQLAIASAYELEGNWQKALAEYQWIVENYPQSIEALSIPIYIADHYQKQQQENLAQAAYQNAIKSYQQVIEQNPATMFAAQALDFMASTYMKLENWQKASETLNSLAKMKLPVPMQIKIQLKLAEIYAEKLNNLEKAIETYSNLLQKYPEIPIASSIDSKNEELRQKLAGYQQSNQAPIPSEIIGASKLSLSSLEIIWEQNRETDFSHYKLLRSEFPNVDSNGSVIVQSSDPKQVKYIDKNIQEGKTYYYRLYVYDKGGLSTASKIISTKMQPQEFRANIQLNATVRSWSTVHLNWNQINEPNFDSYKIYRSTSPDVNLSSVLIKSIYDRSITQLEDDDLKERGIYHYKVFVFNASGEKQPSNEVKIITPANDPPNSLMVNKPSLVANTTVQLSWTPSNDDDFSMYKIYRSERSPVSLTSSPIWLNSVKSNNKYRDIGLRSGKTYYYKIVVYDKGGLYSESNEVAISLK